MTVIDDVLASQRAAYAAHAATVRGAVAYITETPSGHHDADAVERALVSEVAARLTVSRRTVLDWIGTYCAAPPAVRDAFHSGLLPWAAFRALCRALAGTTHRDERLLGRLIDAACGATPGTVPAAIDGVLAEYDATWHRKAREAATAERGMTVRRLPRGQAELRLRGPAEMIADMSRRVTDAARRLCGTDSRPLPARLFDAAHAVITRSALSCTCPDPTCPHRDVDTAALPIPRACIVIDAATAAGLSGEPGHLLGWGPVPADTARRIAADATWQAVITEATTNPAARLDRPSSRADSSLPVANPHRRGRPRPLPGWVPDVGSTARSTAWTAMRTAVDFLRAHPDQEDRFRLLPPNRIATPPPPSALVYAPSAALRAVVEARYATCVAPGCLVPSSDCDLDHVEPFDHDEPLLGGWTELRNLEPLCRTHHNDKTAGLWTYRMLDHGIVAIRDPHGHRYFTAPDRLDR
ncbi:hypothetical protein SAMN05444374_1174 [Rhodococcoides kroppenstedtii]|uniref:HNH nuclease domain-containing protein n=1 Tax=Rhodococcoides kroppenstedtii TaxID=293050 RepID=A0A1I0UAU9_9NOCA|nr:MULTISPECIES: HNH endonuclease signature motif containing protein [Rhodococcus]AMY19157.1 hypothetical protein A3Q40_01772 [Rhodococcus sp. PBTS 1]MBY6311689.1 hypothetical protein [Rhodococcus kroppenstedtii]MBY6319273.1 hypothetical protein [Rhodococcus kroppenstedtii]MBY6397956.1 hypothetical protein [Rhodococcus kroppenstedtii]SFA61155.1 hypothetical protein SAMN05444374_1174 [Rhodococcus kroppenstedtii]